MTGLSKMSIPIAIKVDNNEVIGNDGVLKPNLSKSQNPQI